MKKNYTYILWIFIFFISFFAMYKTDQFTKARIELLRAELLREEFSKTRISKKREKEIQGIAKKLEEKRRVSILEREIKEKFDQEAKAGVDHVNELRKTYPQVKGRIIIEGTKIDFPVVQTDNNDFYLDHDFDNSYYINGGVFIDYVHNGDFSDDNTVIYGHNVRSGFIFNDLNKFRDKDFIKKYSEIIIDTPIERRVFDVVCAMDVNVDANYRAYSYEGLEYENYLKLIRENNILEDKPLPKLDDKIITLSTCSDINDRFAIVAIEKKDKYSKKNDFEKQKNQLLAQKRGYIEYFVY